MMGWLKFEWLPYGAVGGDAIFGKMCGDEKGAGGQAGRREY
jgi:hypothetical protein